ncbi:hypothetical protein QTO34_008260 [Cnephaeus nilssonii]|uniref:Uncharacterized protein n=1 Tax=Cnephaeus nilssonii TaxID=3371016 RepID=A0AA40LTY9_CNENI|nr:hypothetical protein QTO34_008260 [Eptesicus nilssonii]
MRCRGWGPTSSGSANQLTEGHQMQASQLAAIAWRLQWSGSKPTKRQQAHATAEAGEAPTTTAVLASCEPSFWLSSTPPTNMQIDRTFAMPAIGQEARGAGLGVADWAGGTLSSRCQRRLKLSVCAMAVLRHRRGLWGSELTSHRGPSKAGELGACPLVHQAFQKPSPCRRLLKGLVHQRTGTQLPRDRKRKHWQREEKQGVRPEVQQSLSRPPTAGTSCRRMKGTGEQPGGGGGGCREAELRRFKTPRAHARVSAVGDTKGPGSELTEASPGRKDAEIHRRRPGNCAAGRSPPGGEHPTKRGLGGTEGLLAGEGPSAALSPLPPGRTSPRS